MLTLGERGKERGGKKQAGLLDRLTKEGASTSKHTGCDTTGLSHSSPRQSAAVSASHGQEFTVIHYERTTVFTTERNEIAPYFMGKHVDPVSLLFCQSGPLTLTAADVTQGIEIPDLSRSKPSAILTDRERSRTYIPKSCSLCARRLCSLYAIASHRSHHTAPQFGFIKRGKCSSHFVKL